MLGIGRGWLGAAMLFTGRLLVACCNDECVPDTLLQLRSPTRLVEQTVLLELSTAEGSSPKVTCTWASSDGEWHCDPPPRAQDESGLRYKLDGRKRWFVRATGPAGEVGFRAETSSTDPGEGWPTSCAPCYDDALTLDERKLEEAGVAFSPPVPPTFGLMCTSDLECESPVQCLAAPSTGVRHCTLECEWSAQCPLGSFCNLGLCDWLPQ